MEKPQDQDSTESQEGPRELSEAQSSAERKSPAEPTASERPSRSALRKRRRRARTVRLSAIGAGVLAAGAVAAYIVFGTVTVPVADGTKVELSKTDPCSDFRSLDIDCKVSFSHSDSVDRDDLISQSTPAGFSLMRPSSIELSYSSGPAQSKFPDILRQDYDGAVAELYDLGITVGEVKTVQKDDLGANRIVSSSIKAGETVRSGSKVNLEISADTVELPALKGLTREQAELDLENLGLKPEIIEVANSAAPGTVVSQSPSTSKVAKGSKVTVSVAKAEEVKSIKVPNVIGLKEDEAQSVIAAAGFKNITVVKVESSKATEALVSNVAPGVDQTVGSDSNVVIVISTPESK